MIRNLRVSELKPGMFIIDPGIDWTQRPYLYAANMLLKSEGDIKQIEEQGYQEVYVDFSRSATPAFGKEFSDRESVSLPGPKVSLEEELPAARKVHDESVGYARKFMTDMRNGKVNVSSATETVEGIMESLERNADALLSLCRLRSVDSYTHMHCVNVSVLTTVFSRYIGEKTDGIFHSGFAGLFHDLGKALIPQNILNAPRKLNNAEFAAMRQHPQLGFDQLASLPGIPSAVLEGALQHHEKHDGSGYPNGISGEAISSIGRVVGVADVYDALSSERPYKKAMTAHKALGIMYQISGKEFDPAYLARFIRMMGVYPVGSVVELEDGWKGVVSMSNPESPAKPTVRLVLDAEGKPVRHEDRNLADGDASPIRACLAVGDPGGIDPVKVLGLE
jgi:HD-GYP domain-containing protein (c-di-GMP phosphodiesterase class II)